MKIVHRHAGANDENTLVSKALECLADAVVFVGVVVAVQRDLHNRHVQRVLLGIKSCSPELS